MQFEFFAPFLDAETFLNMHAASDDIDFGVNEDMLCLGAQCGLNPHGLLEIVNDETNTLIPDTVTNLLHCGVTSLEYIKEFSRLFDLGFSILHLRILSKSSLSAENIIAYDLVLVFKAMGFTCEQQIQTWIDEDIDLRHIFSLIENGCSPKNLSLFAKIGYSLSDPLLTEFMKNGISAREVASFQKIGVNKIENILVYKNLGVTCEEIFSFEKIGIKTIEEIMTFKNIDITAEHIMPFMKAGFSRFDPLVIEYVKNKISAHEVAFFGKIGIHTIEAIMVCKNADITTEQISSFLQNGFSLSNPLVVRSIHSGISAHELASFTKIGLDTIEAIMACKNAGVTAEQISTFLQNGFSLADPLLFPSIHSGISAHELASFAKIGLDSIEAIMTCKNAGVTAEQISTFLENGFSLSNPHIFQYIKSEISVDEVVLFTKIDVNKIEDIIAYKNFGITAKEIISFMKIGLSRSDPLIVQYSQNGISAQEVTSFTKLGVNTINDIMVYKNAGINSKQIFAFRKIHFQKTSVVKYFLILFGVIFVPLLFILNNFGDY